jgi:hypothetical protein
MLPFTEGVFNDTATTEIYTLLLIDTANAGNDSSMQSRPIVKADLVASFTMFSTLGSLSCNLDTARRQMVAK